MDLAFKEKFIQLWAKYFGDAELPITFYYTSGETDVPAANTPKGKNCLIGNLAKVRKGASLYFTGETISCGGGRKYTGFADRLRPGFEYFLSCGNDTIEGERYKQTPQLVTEYLRNQPEFSKKGDKLVFRRWDTLEEQDTPEVVIFFASPHVISGLFTLANYDFPGLDGVITPFGAGCTSIIQYPYQEGFREQPRAVIGMFDPSARRFVPGNMLTFAVPVKRFETMVEHMEESFLITSTWKVIKNRIERNLPDPGKRGD